MSKEQANEAPEVVEEFPVVYLSVPYPGRIVRQRGINSTHGTIELRAHCSPKELDFIAETANAVGLPRAALVRWLVVQGCRSIRKHLDGKDHDPNPS